MALFIVPARMGKKGGQNGEEGQAGSKIKERVLGIGKKIWAKIPKYSDLQKKKD